MATLVQYWKPIRITRYFSRLKKLQIFEFNLKKMSIYLWYVILVVAIRQITKSVSCEFND